MQRRSLIHLILCLCLAASNGCMVIDELDKAAALMPSDDKSESNEQDEAVAQANSVAATRDALLEKSKEWWDSATSLSPGGVESSIVSCRLQERMQFMSKDDCLSRGGKPGSVSG